MKCDRCEFETKPGLKHPETSMGKHLLTHLGEPVTPAIDPKHRAAVSSFIDAIKREAPPPPQTPQVEAPSCETCGRSLAMGVAFGGGAFKRIPTMWHIGQTTHYAAYECMDDAALANVARQRAAVHA